MPNDISAVGSIARAAQVLDALAGSPDGVALTDVVDATSFTKTTAHRVLAALQGIEYVTQDPETRVYRLGTKLADLSRKAGLIDLAAMSKRGMARLAEATGDTVFLSVAEGPVAICAARAVGSYPIRTLTLDRGDRRPLGVGAGALALYCSMPAKTRAAVNRINQSWHAEYGFDGDALEARKLEFDQRGYALNAGDVVSAMSAVGVPVITRGGRLVAALAIGAIKDRMTADRMQDLVLPVLHEETGRLAARLSDWEEEKDR
ncbi:IclR family transcriptional regulator [Rhodophyticola sp. CCM32]|uniref:IclR family transcriptional regulator n=1 Tax=Rhodophyticola sp. CCM32 TaxID=2916397 RepID=UPI00107FCA73|nr:IclR family transcriptional regulator [Rhodophyticola sp. CCM32]QBY00494.1 IclR family transcriptional regulator [Rhodophyticola sp. CCM32]